RGGRVAADGVERLGASHRRVCFDAPHRRLVRVCVHLRDARTVVRPEGARRGDDLANTSIRFGIGRFNTDEDVDYVIERVVSEVRRLRDLSPLYEMAKEGIDLKSVAWQRE